VNRYDDLELTGSPDLEALRSTDQLLDRLGRREPGPRDLDDPVAAALAVLAGDVDLRPVPVADTRRALTETGLWPLINSWEQEQQPEHDAGRPASAEGLPRLADVGITPPRSMPDGESRWAETRRAQLRRPRSRSRSRRSVARMRPQLDHPRVLRVRPSAGIMAAAALVILGGGVSAAVTSDTVNPLTGITAVFGHWPDGRTDAQRTAHTQLSAKVKQAQDAARHGDAVAAKQIIAQVQGQLQNLNGDDQKKIQQQLIEVQGSLPASPSDTSGITDLAATETSAGDAASGARVSQNPSATSTWSGRSARSSHGYTRSSAPGSTVESSVSSAGGSSPSRGSSYGPESTSAALPPTRPDRPVWTGPTSTRQNTRPPGAGSTPPTSTRDPSVTSTSATDASGTSTSSDSSVLAVSVSSSSSGSSLAAAPPSSSAS
jgi:hypothetical protein